MKPRRTPRKKSNPLQGVSYIDYKDTDLLRKFISDRGKIRSRRVTGVTVQVVVIDVLTEHRAQVPFVGDQHAVGAFGPYGVHPPLGVAVGLRCARRRPHHRHARAGGPRRRPR
ncbi:hypothetical protein Pve01_41320 [Planomonospora venezuelensis]|uniref:Small ribosomal subunit protein bS18 n=1 Tax=Planomonospora venezuelensis TaxID=1999 RepID=A0A841DIT5_PLAVE|nr:ribosomal protein S18 [Planomonospora venezuelensis]GIN02474.1 hypothetical protein Pve01_41320 [Planomonospora venezuelensis]